MVCFTEDDNVLQQYEDLVKPHVDSFDYFVKEGLETVVMELEDMEVEHPVTHKIHRFRFENPSVLKPTNQEGNVQEQRMLPRYCREAGTTYKAPFDIDLVHEVDGVKQRHPKRLGQLPIMVKSKQCHLRNMNRKELVEHKEETNEMGGYFICNGIERIIRCLIMQRRHYIMALRRGAYQKRGANYTECATLIRCVRPDQSSATVRCHYLTDGSVNFAFTMRKAEYFIPAGLLLKAFLEVSDLELYNKIMAGAAPGSGHAAFVAERAELLLQQASRFNINTRVQCLEYLGANFKVVLDLPARTTDLQAGEHLLRHYVFIHLSKPADKLNLLVQMLHKLYALVNSNCCEDNSDALTHHEVLLPGHLLLKFVKEKLEDCLLLLKDLLKKDFQAKPGSDPQDATYLKKLLDKLPDVGKRVEYLLNTGNLVSRSGLDLSQVSGFTVVAEKLNFFRYLSHFRSVHRGAFFAQMRTTTVRKLLPESWGFLCPVHTPDGSPCGLLNHFTAACRIITADPEDPDVVERAFETFLASLGVLPAATALTPPPIPDYLPVALDGKVVGFIKAALAPAVVRRLRQIKAAALAEEDDAPAPPPRGGDANPPQLITMREDSDEMYIPSHTEVAYIPYQQGGPYPGVYIYTQCARMSRPVLQTGSGAVEMLGTLEQLHLAIRCPDGGAGGTPGLAFTHAEMDAKAMLSVVASLTPYSDYNQSPRNMYQCQMAKQTMGTPMQALPFRTDGKLYRIQNPQTPIARTARYREFCMDEYPNGANAVVAVLAYTGYDMEDAMILNKSSVERGFAHAWLYKTEMVDLKTERGGSKPAFRAEAAPVRRPGPQAPAARLATPPNLGAFGQVWPQNVVSTAASEGVKNLQLEAEMNLRDNDRIGVDGLPHVGSIVWPGQSYYSTVDTVTGRFKSHKLKGEEVATVDGVTIVGGGTTLQQANVRLRFNRNPVIGDKFASRHGQKGVLSIQWPDTDMPYCERTGMRPDLIINPHAFPSRMTIGMLVESLVSKAGALTGQFVDASPFQRCNETGEPFEDPATRYGRLLEAHGFARHGQEKMISGVTGEEMVCDIFIGLVYYQRLRHMVSDKFQVRSTGPINPLTRQPIKGRKFGGGIRFGEMERDSLLAHGAAYLLHDRLHASSDYHVLDVCTSCGSILAPLNKPHAGTPAGGPGGMMAAVDGAQGRNTGRVVCKVCSGSSACVERVAMPYVFKFLATELAAMNIKTVVEVQ